MLNLRFMTAETNREEAINFKAPETTETPGPFNWQNYERIANELAAGNRNEYLGVSGILQSLAGEEIESLDAAITILYQDLEQLDQSFDSADSLKQEQISIETMATKKAIRFLEAQKNGGNSEPPPTKNTEVEQTLTPTTEPTAENHELDETEVRRKLEKIWEAYENPLLQYEFEHWFPNPEDRQRVNELSMAILHDIKALDITAKPVAVRLPPGEDTDEYRDYSPIPISGNEGERKKYYEDMDQAFQGSREHFTRLTRHAHEVSLLTAVNIPDSDETMIVFEGATAARTAPYQPDRPQQIHSRLIVKKDGELIKKYFRGGKDGTTPSQDLRDFSFALRNAVIIKNPDAAAYFAAPQESVDPSRVWRDRPPAIIYADYDSKNSAVIHDIRRNNPENLEIFHYSTYKDFAKALNNPSVGFRQYKREFNRVPPTTPHPHTRYYNNGNFRNL
jgi:hypothetical protein